MDSGVAWGGKESPLGLRPSGGGGNEKGRSLVKVFVI